MAITTVFNQSLILQSSLWSFHRKIFTDRDLTTSLLKGVGDAGTLLGYQQSPNTAYPNEVT